MPDLKWSYVSIVIWIESLQLRIQLCCGKLRFSHPARYSFRRVAGVGNQLGQRFELGVRFYSKPFRASTARAERIKLPLALQRATYGRFVAFQGRHAILASTLTGGAVMSLGDTAVQLTGSGTWDYQRNGVVSAYNGGPTIKAATCPQIS